MRQASFRPGDQLGTIYKAMQAFQAMLMAIDFLYHTAPAPKFQPPLHPIWGVRASGAHAVVGQLAIMGFLGGVAFYAGRKNTQKQHPPIVT